MFVCLFAVNAKTTERIDAKRSGITKNDPESVLYGLKSPALVLLGRYDISGFPFVADRHFYFHFRLLRRRLAKRTASTARQVAKGTFTSRTKMLLLIFHYVLCTKNVVYPEALHERLTSVAQLSVINIADIRSAFDKALASERFRRNTVDGAP